LKFIPTEHGSCDRSKGREETTGGSASMNRAFRPGIKATGRRSLSILFSWAKTISFLEEGSTAVNRVEGDSETI